MLKFNEMALMQTQAFDVQETAISLALYESRPFHIVIEFP